MSAVSASLPVALFGGSFNPPHVGHVLAVTYLLSVEAIRGVLVVPVYRHVFGKDLAPFPQRMEMTRRALGWIDGVEVSDIEQRVGGESRTLHTIEALLSRAPDLRLRLVIGSDVLPDLPKWHRFEQIAALAPPIVLGRAGYPHPDAPTAVLPEVSSTEIREHLRAGRHSLVQQLVPRSVLDYVDEQGLYQEGSEEGSHP